jgi:hypothetical protein
MLAYERGLAFPVLLESDGLRLHRPILGAEVDYRLRANER